MTFVMFLINFNRYIYTAKVFILVDNCIIDKDCQFRLANFLNFLALA